MSDLVLLAVMYCFVALGVTVGFHRKNLDPAVRFFEKMQLSNYRSEVEEWRYRG